MDNKRVNTRRVAVRSGLTAWSCREGERMGAPGLQAGSRRWEVPLESGSPPLTANELVRTEDRAGRNGRSRWGATRSGIGAGGGSRRTGRKGPRRRRVAAGKSAPPARLSGPRGPERASASPASPRGCRQTAPRAHPARAGAEQRTQAGPSGTFSGCLGGQGPSAARGASCQRPDPLPSRPPSGSPHVQARRRHCGSDALLEARAEAARRGLPPGGPGPGSPRPRPWPSSGGTSIFPNSGRLAVLRLLIRTRALGKRFEQCPERNSWT
ncbi:translation initiation factor IF-2 [Symphalangus syndactylus]|uniref:translation initiation factor IF-2 n=1 Tax=Symphalangus syndactylus TaxID=9590 RepID=UPI0030056491